MKKYWEHIKKSSWSGRILLALLFICIGTTIGSSLENNKHTQLKTDGSNSAPSQTNSLLTRSPNVSDIDVYQLFQLTNHERAKAGLQQLSLNPKLNSSAAAKCNDMVTKDYWSHYDPAGNPPWHFMTAEGITYIHMGENLGEGFLSAQSEVSGWMKSSEHKANILDPRFTDVGFAVCKSKPQSKKLKPDALVVVQHFAEL